MSDIPLIEFEEEAWARGWSRIGGVDEAGRGPLAGPVVAACVVLEADYLHANSSLFAGLTDSKKLTPARRQYFHDLLTSIPGASCAVGTVEAPDIDRLNILRATHLAMRRAIEGMPRAPDYLLIDGLPVPELPRPSKAIIKGDGLSLSIAAASVLAKVTRDRRMMDLDHIYPDYGFARHKGYPTPDHLLALRRHGPCPEHRRSFGPVRGCLPSIESSPALLPGVVDGPAHSCLARKEKGPDLVRP